MSDTLLDRLAACLNAALANNANAFVEPVSLLWPDEGAQWAPVIDQLSERLPIVSLGGFDPGSRRGPAYWIRCVVGGTVDAGLPKGRPIVYLPGVPRSELRAVDSCPAELAPIAELQYRSHWFAPANGRDWSVKALLTTADRGLGLQVAGDSDTAAALLHALDRLLQQPIDRLAGQVLDAEFFRDLINPNPIRSLLGWLDDPAGFRPRLDDAQWSAFVQQCKADYGFDPALDGEITAARMLAERKGGWSTVWAEYAYDPRRYPKLPQRLRQAKPMELSFEHADAWPQDNEAGEAQLRNLLRDFDVLTADGARKEAARLDAEHAWRRSTVWADLDLAPLAFALEQLTLLADLTAQPLAQGDLVSLTADYVNRGWRADDAVLRALAAARSAADRAAVAAAASPMYRPWLSAGASALQATIGPMANAQSYEPGPPASTAKGTVTVFVDGLRLDIARRVQDRLASIGLDVQSSTSLAALPTVTETAKPVLVPVMDGKLKAGPDFYAARASSGAKADKSVLEALAMESGVQCLSPWQTGEPSGTGWTETGEVDSRGHKEGAGIVDYLDQDVDRVVSRIRELLGAGWQRVDIVTDHGWILLPGGMEKVELPVATAEKKKGRCARLKDGAVVEVPTVPWFWDQDVRIALAPGVTCFEANKEYEHGGVSPQECIVPRITVTGGAASPATGGPEITSVKWLGLLCRIELTGVGQGVVADLRGLPGDPTTSIAEVAKETSGTGKVSLMVPDEEHAGERAHLVLVAADGQILAQRDVVVGKNR